MIDTQAVGNSIDEIEVATVKVISIHLGINATEFNSINMPSVKRGYYKVVFKVF